MGPGALLVEAPVVIALAAEAGIGSISNLARKDAKKPGMALIGLRSRFSIGRWPSSFPIASGMT
jgi:hypothetical protein